VRHTKKTKNYINNYHKKVGDALRTGRLSRSNVWFLMDALGRRQHVDKIILLIKYF
jgi:hypothetical protein